MKPLHLALAALAVGCSPAPDAGWRAVSEGARTQRQRTQLEAAVGAREALFQGLLGELTRATAERGPADAISVCKEIAPRLAQEVGAARGVRIGRTSERLRNSTNAAPAWASSLFADPGAATGPVTTAHEDGRFGVLLPIRIAAPCLACHGATADLAPGVREALARDYPGDRATGYHLDDLRGWFWVEVP